MSFETIFWLLFSASCVLAALAVGSVGTAFAGRWQLTRTLGRRSFAGAGVVSVLYVAVLVVEFGRIADADAGSKATALAKVISELMNCTPIVLPAALIGGVMSRVAAKRLHAPQNGPESGSST